MRIKRILNYEAPYPVADRVLSAMFTRHLGDSVAFARGLYLSAAQIREMAQGGMTFGFHTESHPVLSRLDAAAQRAELPQWTAPRRRSDRSAHPCRSVIPTAFPTPTTRTR